MSHDASGSPLQARTQAFLREFFAKGEELVRDLIAENERLRGVVAEQEEADPAVMIEQLGRRITALESECTELRRAVAGADGAGGDYRRRLDELEREHYRLAAMYVAGSQFHSSATVDEVLRTLTEILLNFVGVGRFTFFAVDEERQTLFPLVREGTSEATPAEVQLPATGPLADVTVLGGPWRTGAPLGDGEGALMNLPLYSGSRLVGVARIERFLPQKQRFDEADFGLLELVSEHAGVGIETAWIRAHAREVPLQRSALERLVGT
jgi:hypothetical protein